MKNKKLHIFSILLILTMIILGVSTPQSPPRQMKNSISYEIREEYFLIKIITRTDPGNYELFSHYQSYGFSLYFDNMSESQGFRKNDNGEIITELYVYGSSLEIVEEITLGEDDFGTFTEGRYFIIKIKNDLIKFENPRLDHIYLRGSDGRYLHEIYLD